MSRRASMSPGVKSQLSLDDEVAFGSSENTEQTFLTQAQFSTQVLFPALVSASEDLSSHHNLSAKIIDVAGGVATIPKAGELSTSRISALLVGAHTNHEPYQHGQDSPKGLKAQNSEAARHVDQEVQAKYGEKDLQETEDLPQVEIQAVVSTEPAPLTTPTMSAAALPSHHAEAASPSQRVVMPTAMMNILRAFRRECFDGRHIPRRLQTIPRDQEALLQADESWQPPLVGKSHLSGTIPLELMNALTQKADDLTKIQTEVDVMEPYCERPVDKQPVDGEDGLSQLDEPGDHESQESQLDSEDWPPSQSYNGRRNLLPPDSSPPGAGSSQSPKHADIHERDSEVSRPRSNRGEPSLTPILRIPAGNGDAENVRAQAGNAFTGTHKVHPMNSMDCAVNTAQKAGLSSTEHGHVIQDFSAASAATKYSSAPDGAQHVRSSTHSIHSPVTSITSSALETKGREKKTVQKAVQVYRTPFISKDIRDTYQIPDSSTIIIPGTFTKEGFDSQSQSPVQDNSSNPVVNQLQSCTLTFEYDSSEDEDDTRQDRRRGSLNLHTTDLHQRSISQHDEQSESLRFNHDGPADLQQLHVRDQLHKEPMPAQRSPMNSRAASRKRVVSTTDDTTPDPAKRQRVSSSDVEGRDSYRFLDSLRRQNRRAFFQSLPRQHVSDKTDSSHHKRSLIRPRSVMSGDSADYVLPSNGTSTMQSLTHLPAIDAHVGMYENRFRSPQGHHSETTGQVKSRVGHDTASDLYRLFQTTYPDYRGGQKHFEAACQLLKRLSVESKATHPSLWDDFVFCHFHRYRAHLTHVIKSFGNALPYEVFYENHVEEPTHLRRIIKPAHLVNMTPQAMIVSSITDAEMSGEVGSEAGRSLRKPVRTDDIDQSRAHARSTNDPVEIHETLAQNPVSTDMPFNTQSTTRSLHAWLERAAGAESPELGTPQRLELDEGIDVPTLDLTTDLEGSNRAAQPRALLTSQILMQPNISSAITRHDTSSMPPEQHKAQVSTNSVTNALLEGESVSLPLTSSRSRLPKSFRQGKENIPLVHRSLPIASPNLRSKPSRKSLPAASSLDPLERGRARPKQRSSLQGSSTVTPKPVSKPKTVDNLPSTSTSILKQQVQSEAPTSSSQHDAPRANISSRNDTLPQLGTSKSSSDLKSIVFSTEVNTTFRQFMRDFNALPVEIQALKRVKLQAPKQLLHGLDRYGGDNAGTTSKEAPDQTNSEDEEEWEVIEKRRLDSWWEQKRKEFVSKATKDEVTERFVDVTKWIQW